MSVYYNEIDPFAAAWLRELMKAGQIPYGEVDERSIRDVGAADLAGFGQCHFFAGIGGWAYALKLAGWPVDRPIWTGSCPCQPWSIANLYEEGAQGDRDERDLWPDFGRLIAKSRPSTLFGEQVTDAIRWGWLDRAFVELEGAGYACAAAVLPALAVGSAHERRRVWFVADACGSRRQGHQSVQRVPLAASQALAINGNPLIDAGRALAGDYRDLLPCDGLSVVMERDALKGYGNAIVPLLAAEFIEAYMSVA